MAPEKQPLVLFLDDLQWADQASLDLLSKLVTSPQKRFLLILGSYRDNDPATSLRMEEFLKQMGKNLMRAAKANEEWTDYKGRKRNFADYAFHMISLLEDGGGFTQQQPTTAVSPQPDADHAN